MSRYREIANDIEKDIIAKNIPGVCLNNLN
ncbi:hypothetical protein IMAU60211_00081 [Lactobacillus helveticus]|nr:hypothetical protein [Lactobacillus helveticus]NRO17095.1 hypothetical protein [Lactobacillus helveticus]NRO19625.1 hypothetical protein [Lactobacillus helveticus]NRO31989.1 hypothetical protein [Lactobacillus helveticus]NRO39958.1 hypothetical protein [Lactobacillus helveticus]